MAIIYIALLLTPVPSVLIAIYFKLVDIHCTLRKIEEGKHK